MTRLRWLLLALCAACGRPDDRAVRATGTIEVREIQER
jgi:hypothetical protein